MVKLKILVMMIIIIMFVMITWSESGWNRFDYLRQHYFILGGNQYLPHPLMNMMAMDETMKTIWITSRRVLGRESKSLRKLASAVEFSWWRFVKVILIIDHPRHHQALAGSRDFQLIKIPGFWKMKSRDFSGSAYRVWRDFLWSVKTFCHGLCRSKYSHSEDTFENT